MGFWPALALNMSNMIGVGPFITIPMLMAALGGPQSMLGWLIALLITIPDSLVWSELGASMPGSGGSYRYLREGFGRETWGRLMAFLFLWQFLISGPLEIASAYIGFVNYLDYLLPGLVADNGALTLMGKTVVIVVGLLTIFLLYRRIQSISRLTLVLWVGVLLTVAALLVTGAMNFDPRKAWDMPSGWFSWSWGFMLGLGTASRVGIYDFLGYYDICFLGDEVREPGRTIPRSIIGSLLAVALIYVGINLSITGIISWREFVPVEKNPALASHVASVVMERVHGPVAARIFTIMILWTAIGSCFALLLGYSRIPFAAAKDGTFFKVFGRLHSSGRFPHISLLVLGFLSMGAAFLPLGTVVDTLVTMRIAVLFLGQIGAVILLRRNRPDMPRPYRIWLYPLPLFVAALGWTFVLATATPKLLFWAAGALGLGVGAYLIWATAADLWPFARKQPFSPK